MRPGVHDCGYGDCGCLCVVPLDECGSTAMTEYIYKCRVLLRQRSFDVSLESSLPTFMPILADEVRAVDCLFSTKSLPFD